MRYRSTVGCVLGAVALIIAAPLAAKGDIVVVDHPVNSDVVNLYDNTGAAVDTVNPTLVSLPFATGVTVGPDGLVYVDTSDPQSIGSGSTQGSVFSYGYNPATGQLTSSNLFVQYDGTPTSVFNPQGMKFGPNGDLYIADLGGNGVVHLYDSSGTSVTTLSPAGDPTAVAFSPAGNLYAATSQGIEEYDTTTDSFNTIVLAASGGPSNPADLAFGADGKLYVLDISSADPAVYQYNTDGTDQSTFLTFASDFQPANFAFGPDGGLYVTGQDLDSGAGEVLRYNSNGSFDDVFISGLTNPGFLAFTNVPEPTGLAGMAGLLLLARRRRRALDPR
jgi:streptogramin lyase